MVLHYWFGGAGVGRGAVDANVLHVLAIELPGLPCSIGEHHIPHRNVRTRCRRRALELGHGCPSPRSKCPLARTATDALEGNVGEQCASPAIRLLARKGAVWYVHAHCHC